MLQALKNRTRDREDGFTLIELMVVVLIIAILLAIAIPTFLGAKGKSQDAAAKSDVRNTLTAEKTVYTDGQNFADNSTGTLTAIEPSLTYGALPGTQTVVGVGVSTTKQSVCIEKQSKAGTFFSVWQNANTGTYYAKGAASQCPATVADTAPAGFSTTAW